MSDEQTMAVKAKKLIVASAVKTVNMITVVSAQQK
jgi:hypothetical protein